MTTNPHQIQALKEGISLPSIVANYTKLRRSGDHHVARCVFHNEKTASMHVWADHLSCFGCNKTTDIFGFLRQVENWTFHQAISYVADQLGVTLTGKRIPKAALAHARESEAFCIWWWKQKHLLLEKTKAEAYSRVEADGAGPMWNWLEYVSGLGGRLRRLDPKDSYHLFRSDATAEDKNQWRADVAFDKEFVRLVELLAAKADPELFWPAIISLDVKLPHEKLLAQL